MEDHSHVSRRVDGDDTGRVATLLVIDVPVAVRVVVPVALLVVVIPGRAPSPEPVGQGLDGRGVGLSSLCHRHVSVCMASQS